MNSYEKDKLQYLTYDEKVRYFEEKVRDLKSQDQYGILNHSDWFFRVVVLDLVAHKMRRLIQLFKQCSWDDFETVYKVVRKLRLLLLDVDAVRTASKFDINKTNLFAVSDEYAKSFTKIDDLLNGNTLYELFHSQVELDMVDIDSVVEDEPEPEKDKEVL